MARAKRHAPGHAAGHFAGHEVPRAAQTHSVELHEDDVAHQRFRQLRVLAQGKSHVVEHAHVGEQGTELKEHAHAPPRFIESRGIELADVLAVEQHLAALGSLLSADEPQHGGLAAARGPHERGDLAARDGKGHPVENRTCAIAERNVAELYKGVWQCGWVHLNKKAGRLDRHPGMRFPQMIAGP